MIKFNYGVVKDDAIRQTAEAEAKQIHELLARTGATLVEIGRRLQKMHEALGRPLFLEWVKCEFGWVQSTASNYMRVAMLFDNCNHLEKFQPAAITQLSRRHIPQAVIDEAFALASRDEMVTYKMVMGLLKKHGVQPQHSSAGEPRKQVEVRLDRGPSIEQLHFVLDAFARNLAQVAEQLPPAERESLADRFLELAMQLRSVGRAERLAAESGPVIKPAAAVA